MAEKDNKERESTEFFLDEDGQDIEVNKIERRSSSSDGEEDENIGHDNDGLAFTSQHWPQSFR